MMLKIEIKWLDQVKQQLGNMAKQASFAASRALNETAKKVQQATHDEMRKVFDRPTPYTLRSMKVERSDKRNLTAIVKLRDDAPGKGTPWIKAIGHQFGGGNRSWRRFEGALQRISVLPSGMAAVPPKNSSWAMQLDAYGNIPRGKLVQILSYLNAFGEQGYKANMTDKRRRSLAKISKTEAGYKTIGGIQYFVSYGGRGRPGGDRYVHGRHDQHLFPGIWARRGTHGSNVAPVILFVRKPRYQRMIDLERIARSVVAKELNAIFNREMAAAIRSAK
jgi:hypothetical protein